MENRFIYHYSAHYQLGMNMFYVDGIAQLKSKITCQEDYRKLKPKIEAFHHDKLTISSLSFIGMEQDNKPTGNKE